MRLEGRPSLAKDVLEEVKLKVGVFPPVGSTPIVKFPALVLSGLNVRHYNEGIRWVEVRVVLGEDGIQEGDFGKQSTLPKEGLKLKQANLVASLHKDVEVTGLSPAD